MQRRFFISILIVISLLVFSGYIKAEISFFWKIQTEKGNSYLLGSVYFLKKEHYPLRKVIEDSFVQCDIFMVGTKPPGENQGKINKLVTELGMYKGEKTLRDNLSGDTYKLLAERLKELGLDIELYRKFKPWIVAIVFFQKSLEKLGFDLSNSYKFYFNSKAKATKKEIIELEGINRQVRFLDSFSKDEQESLLISSIQEIDKFEDMRKLWIVGDIGGYEKLLTEKRMQYPKLINIYNKYNEVLNKDVVKKIDRHLKKGKKLFVVLLTDRMVGKNGIVKLLKNKGYKVNQL